MSLSLFVIAGFIFVDDTNLITVASTPSKTPEQVTACMQAAINAWHGGLHTTGGALNPEICSWMLVAFGWNNGQWYYRTQATLPTGALTILVPMADPITITRHEPSDAIKVVGVHQALDGNMQAQVLALQEKANLWGAQI
jgi:hypothetical protein